MSELLPQTLELQPYDWVSDDRDNAFSIRIWCHTKRSERVLLRVEDYQPFCRIELPNVIGGRVSVWTQDMLKTYVDWLRGCLNEHGPTTVIYKQMQKLYWYRPGVKYPFLICYFQTEEAMTHCIKLVNKKGYLIRGLGFITARAWETSIPTIHRFITDVNLGYGQWFKVTEACPVPELDKISTCEYEYTASYKNLTKLPEELTKGWSTNPLVAAIDIECYSHRHKAMPNKSFAQDVVFQVSYILQRLGNPASRKKFLLVVGDCDEIPGAEILRFPDEISLIDGLCELIKETDPTILTGYNIFKFDFPYMDGRMKIHFREWRNCGLIKDKPTYINTRKWKSSAYGFMELSTLEAEGRLCVDMYTLIKRDHKLDRYTLDFVSKHFLGRGKHDVTARQMFEIYKESREALESGDPERIAHSKKEMARVGAYCLEDSCLCIDLMEALSTWIMLIELSTIVQVTVMDFFTRGQQIRVQNQVYSFVYREDFVIDERPGSKDSFKGAHVFEPTPGKYHNILIFDFASLYPSIIRAYNICYSTLVPDESNIPDEKCHIIEWKQQDEDGKEHHFRYRFIKQEYFHGFLPRMCEHLVAARKATRRQIGPQNDEVTNIVLNQRQLGLKISANSIYGSLGVREGRLPLPEGSSCITAVGRQLTLSTADYVERTGQGKVVYGDSVTGDTPILIREGETVRWIQIQELGQRGEGKVRCPVEGIEVWSELGWTKIRQVISHRTQKRIFRILSHSGCVDVTEDHSLLLSSGTEVKPGQIRVGTRLLHHSLPNLPNNNEISEPEAFSLGYTSETIPDFIFTASKKAKLAFINGYQKRHFRIAGRDKLEMAKLYHLLTEAGHNVMVETLLGEAIELKIVFLYLGDLTTVKGVIEIDYDDYVYDLETENHHFAAGIGQMIVHNTDSIMVDAGITDPHECITKGKALSKEFSSLFPDPLVLEFERALSVALFIKKKKYAGVPLAILELRPGDQIEPAEFKEGYENSELRLWKITQVRDDIPSVRYLAIPKEVTVKGKEVVAGMPLAEGGVPNDKDLLKKGIILARRDNCLWIRECYKKILLNVLFNRSLASTLDLINTEIIRVMSRQVPLIELLITGEIGSNYKPNSTYFIKLFADELRLQGTPIQAGERFDYVFVKCKEEWKNSKLGYKMRLPEVYWANSHEEPLDTLQYIKKLQNPVEQILYLGYKDEIDAFEREHVPPIKRRGKIYTYALHEYVKIWIKLITYKEDLINVIRTYKPHFTSQDPHFIESFRV